VDGAVVDDGRDPALLELRDDRVPPSVHDPDREARVSSMRCSVEIARSRAVVML
jgi:hypothetical protein